MSPIRLCFALAAISNLVIAAESTLLKPVLSDLEDRVLQAKRRLDTAEKRALINSANDTRRRLRALTQPPKSTVPSSATFYPSPRTGRPSPAILVIRPHDSPNSGTTRQLSAELNALGISVLVPDLAPIHADLSVLEHGATPQQHLQAAIDAGLAFLLETSDVDRAKIALVGDTLTSLIAAARHSEIAFIVLEHPTEGLLHHFKQARTAKAIDELDSCTLIPGMLTVATEQTLFALLAPRPALLLNAAEDLVSFAKEIYGIAGAPMESYEGSIPERVELQWLARKLRPSVDAVTARPTPAVTVTLNPLEIERGPESKPQPLSISYLNERLGTPLPEGRITVVLQVRIRNEIMMTPQVGVQIPVTALRPGPIGGDVGRGSLVAISDEGRESLIEDPIIKEALNRSWMVWLLDPRGIGSFSFGEREPLAFFGSLLLGENLVWRQASDITTITRRIAQRSVSQPSGVYAKGKVMSLAALYAAQMLAGVVEWIYLADTDSAVPPIPSYYHLLTAPPAISRADLQRSAPVPILNTPLATFIEADWSRIQQ